MAIECTVFIFCWNSSNITLCRSYKCYSCPSRPVQTSAVVLRQKFKISYFCGNAVQWSQQILNGTTHLVFFKSRQITDAVFFEQLFVILLGQFMLPGQVLLVFVPKKLKIMKNGEVFGYTKKWKKIDSNLNCLDWNGSNLIWLNYDKQNSAQMIWIDSWSRGPRIK